MQNPQKHEFDFADAWQVFKNPVLVNPDTRKEYGEDRWTGIGMMANEIVVVLVFTKRRNEKIRIISMRKASQKEHKHYEKDS